MAAAAAAATATLWINRSDLAVLEACAAKAYPQECCGLLVGYDEEAGGSVGKRVSRILPTVNRASRPGRAFEVDPAAHVALLRSLREQADGGDGRREKMLGHYHSHPDAPAVPSERDRFQATDPDAVWLIVAASAAGAGEIRAWQAGLDSSGAIDFRPMAVTPLADDE